MSKQNKLVEQLNLIREAALKAGIWDNVFLAFGSCLGAVRERGIIGHDNDADVGILADNITREQEKVFYDSLWALKLFEKRHKEQRRLDNNRLLWCSLKMAGSMKTCVWFMFSWNGLMIHSKGMEWTEKIGRRLDPQPRNIEAIGKGIPASHFRSLVEIDWYGVKWKIPVEYGSCLDEWYPNWFVPKVGGASKEDLLLVVGRWKDTNSWILRKR